MSHKQVISYAIAKTRKDVDVDHTGILFCNSLQLFSFKVTGKSFSEALILESVNPQYDKRLFIEFPIIQNMLCTKIVSFLTFKTIFVHNML